MNNHGLCAAILVRTDHNFLEDFRRLLRLRRLEFNEPQGMSIDPQLTIKLLKERIDFGQLFRRSGDKERVGALIDGELRLNRGRTKLASHALESRAKDAAKYLLDILSAGMLKRIQLQRGLHVDRRLIEKLNELIDECDRLGGTDDNQ